MNKFSCSSCAETVEITAEQTRNLYCTNCRSCGMPLLLHEVRSGNKKQYIFSVIHTKYVAPTQKIIDTQAS